MFQAWTTGHTLASGILLAVLAAPAYPGTILMQVVEAGWDNRGTLPFLFQNIGFETPPLDAFAPYLVDGGWQAALLFPSQYPGFHLAAAREAMPLVIWEIIHDSSGGVLTTAGTPQELLVAVTASVRPPRDETAVPEAGGMGPLALGFVFLGLARVLRRRGV